MKPEVDFHWVAPEHQTIHKALENWARWVIPSKAGGKPAPMWARCKPAQHWEAVVISEPIKPLEAQDMEKAVAALPDRHCAAIRWAYVFRRRTPRSEAARLRVTEAELFGLVVQGRHILSIRGLA